MGFLALTSNRMYGLHMVSVQPENKVKAFPAL